MKIQMTPRALRVVDRAKKIALEMHDSHVGTAHLLAALAREDCAAGTLLKIHDLSEETICTELNILPVIDFQI